MSEMPPSDEGEARRVREGEKLLAVVRSAPAPLTHDFQAEAGRLTIIQTLAVVAILTGVLLGLTAPSEGPSFEFFGDLIGWPWLFGMLLTVFGILQLWGVIRHRPWFAYAGSLGCLGWYGLFACGFLIQWISWFTHGHPGPDPSIYPVVVYLGLSSVHFVMAILIYQRERVTDASEMLLVATDDTGH